MSALRFAPPPAARSAPRIARPDRARAPTVAPRGWRDDSPLVDEAEAKSSKRAERKARSTQRRLEASGAETVVGVGKGDSASARLTKIDLGQGKSVDLHVPSDVADVSGAVSPETLAKFKEALYGAGDVVWPAGLALARLIAHCPSLVAGKRVLEVGAGLGVVGNAALRAGASAVCMCDVDGDMLRLAKASAAENAPEDPSRAATLLLDWSAIPETFCVSGEQKYDVVVAADVLYDATAARCVSDVVGRATKPGGMALLCDPENRTHRDDFADAAVALGWETVEADFPGRSDMRLLQATRVEIKKHPQA